MDSTRIIPPQDIESEMAILGSVLMDNHSIDVAHAIIKVDDFYRQSHRLIFEAMTGLCDKGEPIDLVLLSQALKSCGRLEEIGGGGYLYTLADYVPTSVNMAHYCRIVKMKAEQRIVIQKAQEMIGMVNEGKDLSEILDHAETITATNHKSTEPVDIKKIAMESVRIIENRYENRGKIQGIPYGIEDLDEATSGMHRGDLVVIAGRPSMGKSAFVGNIIRNVCNEGYSALFFTLEMSRTNIVERMVADIGNINSHRIRTGNLIPEDWPRSMKAYSRIAEWKLAIDDTAAVSLRDIKSKAKKAKKKGLDLVAIDYLQLMAVSGKENRTQSLGEISRGLKQLARELDLPVVLLSQLNRSVDSRGDKRPLMSDLRDSGEIEQDADIILFPFRPAAYCLQCKDRICDGQHDYHSHQMQAEIIIEKQRNGERNIGIPVAWIGEHQRFEAIRAHGGNY